jgi:hypothetical protein
MAGGATNRDEIKIREAMMSKDNLTTEQLMDAAIRTVQQMSPEEKAKLRQQMDTAIQKMRASLKKVKQLSPEEKTKMRQQLKLETVSSGTLQEFVEGLELSYRALAPAEKKQWLKEVRKSCARFQRANRTHDGGWIQ